MAQIVRADLAAMLDEIPNIAPLHIESMAPASSDDLFLCALGFEPRCLTIPRRLHGAGYQARRAVYFRYSTNVDDNSVNLPGLERCLGGIATELQTLEADRPDFPEQLHAQMELLKNTSPTGRPCVTFDISVTANRLLLRCLKVLLEHDVSLRVVYSEATVYHPTREEYESEPRKWKRDGEFGLEHGVGEIIPSVDHPGHALDPLPDCMILFPSLKRERSKAVISFVDPSLLMSPGEKVIWLVGRPHLEENSWRLDAMKDINGLDEHTTHYEVSTFDYKDTLRVLERLHLERSDNHTITLSPLGSKMQALGTALFCHMHPDVRIILSIPKAYNAVQYSDGCRDVWCIDFGSVWELRRKLEEVGTLRVEEGCARAC